MYKLKTIGYEGADLEDFLMTLEMASVETVVDVRALALSRRRGFSKKALSEALAARGILYLHLQSLGDPKSGREAARSGFMSTFRKIYNTHLSTPEAESGLAELASIAKHSTSCLLCFEADAKDCHRSLIVHALGHILPVEVDHLRVSREPTGRIQGAGRHPGESRTAA